MQGLRTTAVSRRSAPTDLIVVVLELSNMSTGAGPQLLIERAGWTKREDTQTSRDPSSSKAQTKQAIDMSKGCSPRRALVTFTFERVILGEEGEESIVQISNSITKSIYVLFFLIFANFPLSLSSRASVRCHCPACPQCLKFEYIFSNAISYAREI